GAAQFDCVIVEGGDCGWSGWVDHRSASLPGARALRWRAVARYRRFRQHDARAVRPGTFDREYGGCRGSRLAMNPPADALARWRSKIDVVDCELVQLLNRRA